MQKIVKKVKKLKKKEKIWWTLSSIEDSDQLLMSSISLVLVTTKIPGENTTNDAKPIQSQFKP